MTAPPAKQYDPEQFWAKRYSQVDVTRSGHIDMPAAYNLWLYRRKKQRLLSLLEGEGFRPQGARVLEIASGSGVYVEMWQQLGVGDLAGIDISEAAVAAVQARFPKYRFFKRDLSLPGLEQQVGSGFDLVTAVDMLYHIVEDDAFERSLANLAAATRPGGLLAIHDVFLSGDDRRLGYMHLRDWEAYQHALDRAGFDVLVRRPTFFLAVQALKIRSPGVERLHDWLWKRVLSRFIDRFPSATGAFTTRVDAVLGSLFRKGPSFEMVICRRRAG